VELLVLALVAVILACGTYLVLERTLLKVIIGLGLLSNGTNLLLLSSGGLESGRAPILSGHTAERVVDPLPQALILTAIVISFGVTALLLALAVRTYKTSVTDDLGELHGRIDRE